MSAITAKGSVDLGTFATSPRYKTIPIPATGAFRAIALMCSRRHLDKRLAWMPPFIAIAATDAPVTKLCATKSSFRT